MALTDPGRHTEETLTREGDPHMAQTPTKTPLQYAPERPRVDWIKYVLFAAAGILLILGVLLLRPKDNTPAPSPPAPTATVPAAQQQASADTERLLRAWITNYAKAYTTFDPAQLDATLATPDVIAAAKTNLDNLRPLTSVGTTGNYTADIRDIVVTRYAPDQVTLTVCALRDIRFMNNGHDITQDRQGQPKPVSTEAMWQDTEFSKTGDTWKISAFQLDPEQGAPC